MAASSANIEDLWRVLPRVPASSWDLGTMFLSNNWWRGGIDMMNKRATLMMI